MRSSFAAIGRRPRVAVGLLCALCVVAFAVTIPLPRVDNLLIGSDGIRYYKYARSLAIDRDLDFTNEYLVLRGPNDVPPPTAAGRPPNNVSVGMGLLWLPFFLLAHGIASFAGLPHDGYGYLYQAAVCLGSQACAFAGLFALLQLCLRQRASAASALIAVVLVWFGGNLIYYVVAEPSMSHATSFGAVSCLLAWWRLGDRASIRYWIVLGALGATCGLIRPQDALFLALPAIDWLLEARRMVARDGTSELPRHIARGALVLLGVAMVASVQLYAWWSVYGSVLESGYRHGGKPLLPHWSSPRVLSVLFSLRHGLFTWHPVYLAGVIGLWWVAKSDRRYGLLLLLGFAAQAYVVASWRTWWQDDSFGARMLISTAPIAAVGLTELVERASDGGWMKVTVPAMLVLWWNLAFFIQYRFGFISMSEAITVQQLVWDKLTLPFEIWRHVMH
jgi:hypothetical protein